MTGYVLDMVLCGFAYVIVVYLMMKLVKRKEKPSDDDNDDGGINLARYPELDLPPGITLPDSPLNKKPIAESEEMEVC